VLAQADLALQANADYIGWQGNGEGKRQLWVISAVSNAAST
jgi:hypothetical protein